MALSIFDRFITQTESGATIGGASVTVTVPGTGALAQLYEDRNGADNADNPFTADANGRAQFYLAPGRYNVSATGGGVTINYPDVLIGLEFVDGIQSVATIADLYDLEPTEDGIQVSVSFDAAGNPLSNGTYVYDSSSSDADDDGITTVVTNTGERFKRKLPLAPLITPIAKLKPSKNTVIAAALERTSWPQLTLGDGRRSVGSSDTDMVYRTAHNSSGGTDGSFSVIARFAVPVNKVSGDAVNFEIQLDPAYLGGVVVRGIRTNDSLLASGGISSFTPTNNGGGNWTFGPFTPTGGSDDFYGLEVRLNPVDTTNNATLHDEFFVVQQVLITQGAGTLIDSTQSLSGSTWAQQIYVALPKAFTSQTLPSAAANDVYVTHTQHITGATLNWAYCANDGLSSNDGTEFSPWDLNTVRGLLNGGALSNLILKAGNYVVDTPRPRNIFTPSGSVVRVVCPDGGVVIDSGEEALFSSMVSEGSGTFSFAYDPTSHFNASAIASGGATPKPVLKTLTKNLTEVLTVGEVATTDWSFYWDNVADEFHIRFDGTLTDDVVVTETGDCFLPSECGALYIVGVKMYGTQARFLNIEIGTCEYYETYETGTALGNAAGNIYDIDNVNGIQVDDYLVKSQADGYNYHEDGHTELFDCIGLYCKDDSLSHHDNCTGYLQGGEYSYSGKGGVIPAFGAQIVCYRVTAEGNLNGDSPLAQDFNYGGFVTLSNAADTRPTTMLCYDCIGDGNYINYLSSGSNSHLTVMLSTAENAGDVDFASAEWDGQGDGQIDVIKSTGTFSGTVEALRVYD